MILAKESESSKKETVGLIWKSSPEKFPFVVLRNLRRGFCNWIIFAATGRLNFQWNSLLRSCAIPTKDVNRDEQNRRFCWPTSQLIPMLGILIGGRFWDFTCLIWNFLIWKQQNLHIKENDQHLVQLLPNKLVTPFITVLLVSITRSLVSSRHF